MPRVQFKAISPSMSSEDVALMLGEPREWSLMGQESSDRVMHRLREDENNPPDEFYVSRGGYCSVKYTKVAHVSHEQRRGLLIQRCFACSESFGRSSQCYRWLWCFSLTPQLQLIESKLLSSILFSWLQAQVDSVFD